MKKESKTFLFNFLSGGKRWLPSHWSILRENGGCFESEIKEKTTLEAAKAMPFIVGKCLSESHSFFNPFIHINWPEIIKKGDE